MGKVEIFDDFLSKEAFSTIDKATEPGSDFPWFFHFNNLTGFGPDAHLRNSQHSHIFLSPNEWHSNRNIVIDPIIEKLSFFILVRIKANLLLYSGPEPFFGGLHVDVNRDDICMTGLLYLDTCSGPTEFENGEKVDSVANRFIQFPANTRHGSWGPTDVPYRRVINFNWIPF